MIAVLKKGTTEKQIKDLTEWLESMDLKVHLSKGEFTTIIGLVGDTSNVDRELLESFGFEIEEFGARTYAVRAVPYVFNAPSNVSFFVDIIDMLADKNMKSIYDTKEDAIATMSCKAAVKGNDRLSYSEAQELIQRLLKLENPFTCPHGRPTIIEMTRYELEKKFKRIQD